MAFPEWEVVTSAAKPFEPIEEDAIRGMLKVFDPSGENTAAIAEVARLFRLPHRTLADQLEFITTYIQAERLTNPRIR